VDAANDRLWTRALSPVLETANAFLDAQPFQRAAALSYYTLLSMAPLVLVITGFGGFVLGEAAVRRELLAEMDALVGHEGAALMETVMENARRPERGLTSMIVGVALMLFGASTVFAELQATLNRVWGVESRPRNALGKFVRARLESFAMVLGTGFLLLVSLVTTAAIAAIQKLLPVAGAVWQAIDAATSLVFVTVVLALLFKCVPDAKIAWRDTWFGAALTSVMFTVGKYAIGLYLGHAGVGSAYGAAGSAVVLMVWVYYAALIFFLGAVATKVIARRRGSPLRPSAHARAIGAD
jgi:membrane protein